MKKKIKQPMAILLWIPNTTTAWVQGESDKDYLVDYSLNKCQCEWFMRGHNPCKHILFVLAQMPTNPF